MLQPARIPGRLHLGDNLAFMQTLAPALDLIYLDPPFFTGRQMKLPERPATTGFSGFSDRWADLEGYLQFLEPRLREAHRLLAPCGSLVVHLDWHAVHYVKVMLDRIFGYGRLVNEIVWCYSIGAKSPRHFGRKHDTLLWYAKGDPWYFAPSEVAIPRKPNTHMKLATDAAGRQYQEKRDRRTGKVYRYYVDEGKTPEDWWIDVETLNREDRERTGYPTQKPEALLARLVRGLCPPGGRVGDFFCGSGTTLVAAERHGRAWIGCDCLPEAVAVAEGRLQDLGAGIWRS